MAKTVLLNGFSSIHWEFYDPRESTKKKGKALISANHLFNVEEVRQPGENSEIFAKCVKQTNVTEAPWNLNIVLDQNRNVIRAHCSCTGGGDGKCKHMFALVDFINTERTESKTDEACKFRAPSQRGKQLYPKGQTADKIFQIEAPMARLSFKVSEEQKDQIAKDLEAVGDSTSMMAVLLKKRAAGLPKVEPQSAPQQEEIPTSFLNKIFQVNQPFTFSDRFELDQEEVSFIEHNVLLSKEKALKLCQMTTSQSASQLWRDERKIRVTASQAHKIAFAKSDQTRLKYFLENKSLDGIEAVKYGLNTEPEARRKFQEMNSVDVVECGLVVKLDQPWIAASPDGLFLDATGALTLLEIKCPFSMKNALEIDMDYIKDNDLKKRHPYFTQVQIAMHVCGVKSTHFFIYSKKATKTLIVDYDDAYC